jgi:hypothetical protein
MTGLLCAKNPDAAVDRLNVAGTETIGLAIPFRFKRKNKYPPWFFGKLDFYVRKKNYFNTI